MKRPNYHTFAQFPSVGMQRSAFDQSFTYKTTLDAGYLVPCFQPIEILPGDTLNLRLTSFSRLATLVTPYMDNLYMDYFFFFVPNRLVWDDWEEFICADVNGPQGLIPQLKTGSSGSFAVGSLADYFGLPTGVNNLSVSVLPFRAYNLIFNEWFKRESLVTDAVINTGSTDETWSDGDYVLRRRSKRPDYFVSAALWPQKGPGVELPLGGEAPVRGNGKGLGLTDGTVTGDLMTPNAVTNSLVGNSLGQSLGASNTYRAASGLTSKSLGVVTDPDKSGLVADLSQATAATINSLRQAFQIQRLFERDALAGNGRYVEVLRSHFNVVSPDARLQRPEYLGGGHLAVNVHTVAQTSGTSNTSPQANLAGFGVGAASGVGFTKSFVEHGYVIGLMSVRGEQTYQYGIDRMSSRKGRFDFYWPVLAHLGEQAVLNKEIYAQGDSVLDTDGNIVDGQPFGYQERWAEYRYGASKITGKLRSSASGSLDVWHLAQKWTQLPVLGETFVQEDPPVNRVIAVQNEPQFIYDSVVRARFVRPLPMYSVPGLVDHFYF
nr:MAG: major capsid protein [Microviridae sp.]